MTKLGLVTTKGKALTAQTFQKILENPLYAGWIVVPSWDERWLGAFDSLVSNDLFEQVQDVLSGKKTAAKVHNRNHPDFPLRVFVVCSKCDRPLTGSWSTGLNRKYAYYHCREQTCRGVNIKRDSLETKFVELLEWLTPDASVIPAFQEVVKAVWKQRKGDAEVIYAKAKHTLAVATERKNTLVKRYLDDRIDQATYDEQIILFERETSRSKRS